MASLNPYYTGIHLHAAPIMAFVHHGGLNPYYTGIHLHKKQNPALKGGAICLNPYYTGIHLHILMY